jgi:glycine/D-amino acid oxidase-like deaminating enzyme
MPRSVLVVGAGIIGLAAAWQLAEKGHAVSLVDPALATGHSPADSGSAAALGVLMGRVFQRSSGRAWRLRQQSNALWPQWIAELKQRGHRLPYRRGLLLLAADERELMQQERIAGERAPLGMPMRMLGPEELKAYQPALPGQPLGGLLSADDGQLDPGPVLAALLCEARRAGAQCIPERAVAVERCQPWRLTLASGQQLQADCVVLALGLQTSVLLAGLSHGLPLEPVLGQALELELPADPGWNWPGAVVWRGSNLVPRPDLEPAGRRLWLGATLEPGAIGSAEALHTLRELGGEAPHWLQQAVVVSQWQGLRCRPQGRPAPVLEEPEPGLVVASGHYRNGLLLAPATAAWICGKISSSVR